METTAHQCHFGTMAYRPYRSEALEDEQLDHGSVSLAGIIKVQPSRKKGNKVWRPMQASDIGETSVSSGNSGFHFAAAEDINVTTVGSTSQYLLDRTAGESFPPRAQAACARIGAMCNDTSAVEYMTSDFPIDNVGVRQSEMRCTMTGTREQLFGDLPDPIRLHEQMGKFDGEVVFIGHPNRDISAHQWSSSSFQWVNIERYSYSRGKVEGSLASDRLRGIDETPDTLAYFKLAAENRQMLIVENGRPKDHVTMAGHASHMGTVVVESNQTCTTASMGGFRIAASAQSETTSSSSTAFLPPARDLLEDPFVAAANVSVGRTTGSGTTQGTLPEPAGSLDFTYRFPPKTIAAPRLIDGADTSQSNETGGRIFDSLSAPTLQEVAFGEEAATQRTMSSTIRERLYAPFSTAPLKPFHGGSQHRWNVNESQSTSTAQARTTQSAAHLNTGARHTASIRPASSFTRLQSNCSGAAVPSAKITPVGASSDTSKSDASTVNAAAVGLHYSDPDSLRRTQHYEVANGLNQQLPTPQSFKGPFFTDTKPTTHDPTVALSVRISEEEKLASWFHDGHRPARQREYAKSLIAAAATSDKTRHFGTIGETDTKHGGGPYANTAPFVRLYENLSEYVEEYRNGGGQSYFTRGWKPAAPQLRELGLDNSNSYFSKRGTQPSWYRGALLRPTEHVWR